MGIRVAGNTECPCYWTIRSKGFDVDINYIETNGSEGYWNFTAVRDDLTIQTHDIYDLLADIASREIRDNNGEVTIDELNDYKKIINMSPTWYLADDDNEILINCPNASFKKITPFDASCYWAIKDKGYEVGIYCSFYRETYSDLLEYVLYDDYMWDFTVIKEDEYYFSSGTTIQEALALLVVGEVRGFEYDSWRTTKCERDTYWDMKDNAPIFETL